MNYSISKVSFIIIFHRVFFMPSLEGNSVLSSIYSILLFVSVRYTTLASSGKSVSSRLKLSGLKA